MNKTLSIGLAGYSFMIEEHAYIKLSDYLTALRNSLEPNEAEEVMHDIEIRMVEILRDSLGKREVVNDADVEKVIALIGTPEKIEAQEEAYYSEQKSAEAARPRIDLQKQLFRDPENKKIAGVCSGLAHYFGIDATWMRLIWVAIFLLTFVHPPAFLFVMLVYIVLWLVLPNARTAADFLKMKGEPLNFNNIKNQSNKIVQFANDSTQKMGEILTENKPYVYTATSNIGHIVRYILGGLLGIFGLGLLFSSVAVLGLGFNNTYYSLPGQLQFYLDDASLHYSGVCAVFLTIFIPALIFIFLSIKLLSPKTRLNYTGYVFGALGFLWLLCTGFFGVKALNYAQQFKGADKEEAENVTIPTTSDSILVDVKKVQIPTNFQAVGSEIFTDKKTIYKSEYPHLAVTRKDGTFAPYLVVKKHAKGYNQPLQMQVPVEVNNNKILLPNYVTYPYANRLRYYDVDFELIIPKSKKVIALNNQDGYTLDDDQKDNTTQSGTPSDSTKTANKITISGDNLVTVNGKKVTEEEADRMMKEADKKDFKEIGITIVNGKKEITIKTR